MRKIISIVGTRPNFIKIASLMNEFKVEPNIDIILVHTGQHYDEKMSDLFFRQMEIPRPDLNLGCGGGSHAQQTANIMMAFEPVVLEHKPDAVLVVGDVNSTIACGLVSVKLGVKLIHVEAGLRSGDRSMPEEINRILTDSISDILFCTEQSGVDNLHHEGIYREKVHLVGNVMIDTLFNFREKADVSKVLDELRMEPKKYAVITLHRPSNVDDRSTLLNIFKSLQVIQEDIPVIFPIHPRTRKNIIEFGLEKQSKIMKNLLLIEPLGYLDFLKLMSSAQLVLTDSGGIQEETTILKVPCLTLRMNTERPITIEMGTNRLVGTDPEKIIAAYSSILKDRFAESKIPPLWDGKAAKRIIKILSANL